jgi:hypothetical protein
MAWLAEARRWSGIFGHGYFSVLGAMGAFAVGAGVMSVASGSEAQC